MCDYFSVVVDTVNRQVTNLVFFDSEIDLRLCSGIARGKLPPGYVLIEHPPVDEDTVSGLQFLLRPGKSEFNGT